MPEGIGAKKSIRELFSEDPKGARLYGCEGMLLRRGAGKFKHLSAGQLNTRCHRCFVEEVLKVPPTEDAWNMLKHCVNHHAA